MRSIRLANASPAASLFALLLGSGTAMAHIDLTAPGIAGSRQILDFEVGHGCAGSDTVRIEIRLPTEITSVRAVPWQFGEAEVLRNAADVPVAVVWTKTSATPRDEQLYTVSLRVTVPNMPFSTLYFPAIQTCRSAAGVETVAEWIGLPGDPDEPAPALRILPPRFPGWNRYTVPATISNLAIFDDAEIVWQGDAAYSSNPAIRALIETEPGVTVLTEVVPGTDVWVRY
ncbi:MAG: DUF1775 domain-containing protein [Sandaracinaceae bacterium]|nr:DUF1775 domain-containing protein [Sandaracinaceae bacterium]